MKVKNDHRSKCSNLSNCKEEAWKKKKKKIRASTGFESRWSPDFFYFSIYFILFSFFIYFIYLLFFFRLLLSNCLNWKIYCDHHFSLSEVILVGWFSKCQSIKKVGADVSQKKVCIRLSFRFALLARMLFTKRNENWAWSQVT